MTALDRNEIWAQAFDLGQMIIGSPEVTHYKACEKAMEDNPTIATKVRKFRDLQEQYERLSEHSQGPHLEGMRSDIKKLSAELDNYPEVQAYKAAMHKVDELLQAVTSLIAQTVSEKAQA